jgi:ABC-type dipeptide/oligopeptide/nickel transport system ATPase component
MVDEVSVAAEPPLLEVDELTLVTERDGSLREIVSYLNVAVSAGQRMGIVGESGSGKSMTASAIMALLPEGVRVGHGSVRVLGRDLAGQSEAALREMRGRIVSIVYQNALSALNPMIPVGRQIADVAQAHLDLGKVEARARAVELMAAMGIPDPARRARDYPHQFSGGMAQRVAIALALVCEPKLVIADEPTTGLDATIQVQVLATIDRSARETGAALLLITHDLLVVESLTDELLVFLRGVVVERGPTADVMSSPLAPYTRALVTAAARLRGDVASTAERSETTRPIGLLGAGCPFDPDCALDSAVCRETPTRLREVAPGRLVARHVEAVR